MKQDLYSHGEFKLFNPNGETFGNKIIGSETTGIMAISEGKYTTSHVSDLYDVMSLNIWNPKRTDLTNDIKTVNELISYEFDAYIDELGFLTYLDSIQTTFPAQLMRHVTAPEFRLLLSFQPLQEGIHCLIDGTEVLTDKGFIPFSELTYEHKVAVYNENNSISFEIPQEIICSDYKGDMHEFKNDQYHQIVTSNHRIPFHDFCYDEIRIWYADQITNYAHIFNSFNQNISGHAISIMTLPTGVNNNTLHNIIESDEAIEKSVIPYEGKIYCVTVSTGMFVVRYKDKVSITGNSQSYSYVIESLFKGKQRRDIYDRWRNNKIMFERIEFISKLYQDYIDTPNLYNFFRALIADYILEGLYFYSGFKFFNSLSSKALMTGTNSIINLIQRDEITHITLYERLINLIQAENKNIIPQELFIDIMDIAVQHENKFSISTLCNCVGFSEQIITQYTGYRANLLLKRVGIKDNPYSSFVKNPFVHFDSVAEGTDGVTRESNVFTNQVVDYQFSDAESRWTDDIFDDEDK